MVCYVCQDTKWQVFYVWRGNDIEIAVFWGFCSPVHRYQCFGGTNCLSFQGITSFVINPLVLELNASGALQKTGISMTALEWIYLYDIQHF